MMVIPVVTGVLWMVPKGFEKRLEELEIRERIKTLQTIELLRLSWILRRVLEIWNLLLLRLQLKTTS